MKDTVRQCCSFDFLTGIEIKDSKDAGSLRFYKPKFSYIFCDMDGEFLFLTFNLSFGIFLIVNILTVAL